MLALEGVGIPVTQVLLAIANTTMNINVIILPKDTLSIIFIHGFVIKKLRVIKIIQKKFCPEQYHFFFPDKGMLGKRRLNPISFFSRAHDSISHELSCL